MQETIQDIQEKEVYESKRKIIVDVNAEDIKKCDSGIIKCDKINGCIEVC